MGSDTFECLRERKVTTLNNEPVSVSSMFEDGGAVIFLIRRLGCPICREDAQQLCSLKKELDARTPPVRLICIAGNKLGHEEFLEEYWNGELYIDLVKPTIFSLIQEERFLVRAMESLLTGYHILGGFIRTSNKRIKHGPYGAEALEQVNGGVWVIGAGDEGILYQYGERAWGASVILGKEDEIRKAVNRIGTSQGDIAG